MSSSALRVFSGPDGIQLGTQRVVFEFTAEEMAYVWVRSFPQLGTSYAHHNLVFHAERDTKLDILAAVIQGLHDYGLRDVKHFPYPPKIRRLIVHVVDIFTRRFFR